MARARRRRRGTWLPNLGTLGPEGIPDDDDQGVFFQLNIGAGEVDTKTLVVPLTFDLNDEDSDLADETSLSDLIGSEYIIQRIVGSIYVARQTSATTNLVAPVVKASCGLFVARQTDSTINADIPIGANDATELRESYSPSNVATVREPWMWRRTWLLGNLGESLTNSNTIITLNSNGQNFPPTNVGYGNYMNGTGVDVKSKRRVRQDERLWFVGAVRALNGFDWVNPFVNVATANTRTLFHFDYRIFGNLVKAQQRSSF